MRHRLFPVAAAALLAAVALTSCSQKKSDNEASQQTPAPQEQTAAEQPLAEQPTAPVSEVKMAPTSDQPTIAPSLKSAKGLPVVVDFYADWCGPCQQFKPIFHEAEGKYAGKIDFKSVDVDAQADLADKYGIRSIPTLIFFDKEGREVYREIGYIDAPVFTADLTALLAL